MGFCSVRLWWNRHLDPELRSHFQQPGIFKPLLTFVFSPAASQKIETDLIKSLIIYFIIVFWSGSSPGRSRTEGLCGVWQRARRTDTSPKVTAQAHKILRSVKADSASQGPPASVRKVCHFKKPQVQELIEQSSWHSRRPASWKRFWLVVKSAGADLWRDGFAWFLFSPKSSTMTTERSKRTQQVDYHLENGNFIKMPTWCPPWTAVKRGESWKTKSKSRS